MDLSSKFKAAFLASALGDAIGELAFKYRDRKSLLSEIKHSQKLIYTDDIAMAIALAEYLIENDTLNVEKLGEKFAQNYESQPWRGYGPGPPKIFSLAKKGLSYQEVASSIYPGGSYGNGAAMRITPAGLYFYNHPDFYQQIKLTSLPTHTHPLAIDGAVVLAKAIGFLVDKENFLTEELIDQLLKIARTGEFKHKIKEIENLLSQKVSLKEAKKILGNNSTALRSVPFAIFSFLRNKENFEEGLIEEVMVSGDRDTVGCMSSGLWGAYLGKSAIPKDWLIRLENRNYIEKLAQTLYEKNLKN